MALDTNEKTFIQTILTIADKLNQKDQSVMDDVATLNGLNLTEDDKGQVEDIIISYIDNAPKADKSFIESVINGLAVVDRDYLLAMCEITMVDTFNRSQLATLVESYLNNTISFSSEIKTFNFYKKLSMVAIITRNSALIQKAIQKVETL